MLCLPWELVRYLRRRLHAWPVFPYDQRLLEAAARRFYPADDLAARRFISGVVKGYAEPFSAGDVWMPPANPADLPWWRGREAGSALRRGDIGIEEMHTLDEQGRPMLPEGGG